MHFWCPPEPGTWVPTTSHASHHGHEPCHITPAPRGHHHRTSNTSELCQPSSAAAQAYFRSQPVADGAGRAVSARRRWGSGRQPEERERRGLCAEMEVHDLVHRKDVICHSQTQKSRSEIVHGWKWVCLGEILILVGSFLTYGLFLMST